jgi:hypothetical protein
MESWQSRVVWFQSGDKKKYGKEVATAATQNKKMPHAMAMANALIGNIKNDAHGVEHSPGS